MDIGDKVVQEPAMRNALSESAAKPGSAGNMEIAFRG